ncbi:MAG: hypothetical protein IJI15_03340 [Atopobiaceae bacterium]|nr:hypothetical protein [Atopobiaceae bacterium]
MPDPAQRQFARKVLRMMAEFYQDPENERRYQEWKRSREERRAQPASKERATPIQAMTV